MEPAKIPEDKLNWAHRALLVGSFLKHLQETEFPDEMINLLEEFLKTGGEYVKEVIETQFSPESLCEIYTEWCNNKATIDGNNTVYLDESKIKLAFNANASTETLVNICSNIEDIMPDLINELTNRVIDHKEVLSSQYCYYSIFEQLNECGYYSVEDLEYGISLFAVLFEQENQAVLPRLYSKFEKLQANYKVLIRYYVQMINKALNNRDDFDIDGKIEKFLDVIIYACDLLKNFNDNYDSKPYNAMCNVSIPSWKEKAGKICSEELQRIFDNDSTPDSSSYGDLSDKILQFVPDDINALRIKNWCLEVQLDECENDRILNIPIRPICEIASDIKKDWGNNVNVASEQYLDAMLQLVDINDDFYGSDSARDIVSHFLANSLTYVGTNAKKYKRELKNLLNQEVVITPSD